MPARPKHLTPCRQVRWLEQMPLILYQAFPHEGRSLRQSRDPRHFHHMDQLHRLWLSKSDLVRYRNGLLV
jgi:hypothetical protein